MGYVCNNWNDFYEFVSGGITPRQLKQCIDNNRKHKAYKRNSMTFGTHTELLVTGYALEFKLKYTIIISHSITLQIFLEQRTVSIIYT
jgi:hypothetical protein